MCDQRTSTEPNGTYVHTCPASLRTAACRESMLAKGRGALSTNVKTRGTAEGTCFALQWRGGVLHSRDRGPSVFVPIARSPHGAHRQVNSRCPSPGHLTVPIARSPHGAHRQVTSPCPSTGQLSGPIARSFLVAHRQATSRGPSPGHLTGPIARSPHRAHRKVTLRGPSLSHLSGPIIRPLGANGQVTGLGHLSGPMARSQA